MSDKLPKYNEEVGGYVVQKSNNGKVVTNDGRKGGIFHGKTHQDPGGGIKAVVDNERPILVETGEVIINKAASKKHWKLLSKINTSAGNGVPIGPPAGATDKETDDDFDEKAFESGGDVKIKFNPNHIPKKYVMEYAEEIKSKHPEIWKMAGNVFGNEAYENLRRAYKRGYWLKDEAWMYIKWRGYVARHKQDFQLAGVIAMLKWVDTVDNGFKYMKSVIQEEIRKRKKRKPNGAKKGQKEVFRTGGQLTDSKVDQDFKEIEAELNKKLTPSQILYLASLLNWKQEEYRGLSNINEKLSRRNDLREKLRQKVAALSNRKGFAGLLNEKEAYHFTDTGVLFNIIEDKRIDQNKLSLTTNPLLWEPETSTVRNYRGLGNNAQRFSDLPIKMVFDLEKLKKEAVIKKGSVNDHTHFGEYELIASDFQKPITYFITRVEADWNNLTDLLNAKMYPFFNNPSKETTLKKELKRHNIAIVNREKVDVKNVLFGGPGQPKYEAGGILGEHTEYAIIKNGFFLDLKDLSKIKDTFGQVPKNLDAILITFNSGGQENLKVIDTVNMEMVNKLNRLFNLSREQAYVVYEYYIQNAKRIPDQAFLSSLLNSPNNNNVVIIDRDFITYSNFSFKSGGALTEPETETLENWKDLQAHIEPDEEMFAEGGKIKGVQYKLSQIYKPEQCTDLNDVNNAIQEATELCRDFPDNIAPKKRLASLYNRRLELMNTKQ